MEVVAFFARDKNIASPLSNARKFGHRREDVGLLLFEEALHLFVRLAGFLGAIRIEGDVDVLQELRIQLLVDAPVVRLDVILAEVHEDKSAVHLNDAVLKAAVDAELQLLRLQADGRCVIHRNTAFANRHFIELAEGFEHRRADCRGAGEADKTRNVRAVLGREIATRQLDVMLEAILEEKLRHSLQHANAAVVTIEAKIAHQALGRIEHRIVDLTRDETHLRRFRQREIHAIIRKGKRQRLTEIAIGGVSEESRAREGSSLNRFHCFKLKVKV